MVSPNAHAPKNEKTTLHGLVLTELELGLQVGATRRHPCASI